MLSSVTMEWVAVRFFFLIAPSISLVCFARPAHIFVPACDALQRYESNEVCNLRVYDQAMANLLPALSVVLVTS